MTTNQAAALAHRSRGAVGRSRLLSSSLPAYVEAHDVDSEHAGPAAVPG